MAPPQSVNNHSVQRNIATPDSILLLEQWISGTGEASLPVAVAVDRLLDLRKLVGTRREALVDVVLAELTAMHSVPAGWLQAQLERLRSELSAAVVDTPEPPCEDLAHVSSFPSDAPVLAALVLVVGVVGMRALRTTTTEISRAEVVDRYERAVEDGPTMSMRPSRRSAQTMPLGSDASSEPATTSTTSTLPAEPRRQAFPCRNLVSTRWRCKVASNWISPPAPSGRTPTKDSSRSRRSSVASTSELTLSSSAGKASSSVRPKRHRARNRTHLPQLLRTRRSRRSFLHASPVSVDATSWRCESETSIAVRAVTTERVVRVVAGEEREVIVFTAELVEGDHPDNVELIELWVDVATGMTVQERRTYDLCLIPPRRCRLHRRIRVVGDLARADRLSDSSERGTVSYASARRVLSHTRRHE